MIFTVHGIPAGQGNHRVSRSGAIYETTKNHKPWREAVLWAVLQDHPHAKRKQPILLDGPVAVDIFFTLRRPKSAKRGAMPDKKPDIDKLLRSTFDALKSAGVYEDDSRVVRTNAVKRYVGHVRALTVPGAVIFVEAATDEVIQIRTLDGIHGEIHANVEIGTQLYTDDHMVFSDLDGLFYRHDTVNHSAGEYARGPASTNSIESVWAVLKRGIHGVYHKVSAKHLFRYVDEFTFRLNEGNVERHTLERLDSFVDGIAGKRLTYARLIA